MPEGKNCENILAFKNRQLVLKNTKTNKTLAVQTSCSSDGVFTIADAASGYPEFIKQIRLPFSLDNRYVLDCIGKKIGAHLDLISCQSDGVELDSSALEGLKKMPVDIFDNIYLDEVKNNALVLCVDIRNFSNFLCAHKEDEVFRLIKEFTSNLLSCVNQFGYGCNYYKLMGDGAIIIWDYTNPETVASALGVFDSYIDFVNEELFAPYPELGMAGALVSDRVYKYEISAEASQLKYRDYVGYGINLSCRIQALARKDELVINRYLADSGLVPHYSSKSRGLIKELHRLKGLKQEDQGIVFYYKH